MANKSAGRTLSPAKSGARARRAMHTPGALGCGQVGASLRSEQFPHASPPRGRGTAPMTRRPPSHQLLTARRAAFAPRRLRLFPTLSPPPLCPMPHTAGGPPLPSHVALETAWTAPSRPPSSRRSSRHHGATPAFPRLKPALPFAPLAGGGDDRGPAALAPCPPTAPASCHVRVRPLSSPPRRPPARVRRVAPRRREPCTSARRSRRGARSRGRSG